MIEQVWTIRECTHTEAEITIAIYLIFLKKWANPGLFSVYFRLFKQTLKFLQQINVKNVHPVSSTGIQTHNLMITSLPPYPLDQGLIFYSLRLGWTPSFTEMLF